MTYTPGPWIPRKINKYESPTTGWYVENITGWGQVTTTEANARLIAAAPELLGMLETCYGAIKSLDNDALGSVPDKSPTEQGWYIRDELLHNIAGIIRSAKGGE